MFSKASRYNLIAQATITDDKGREIRYIKVRFIPKLKSAPSMAFTVKQGERLDHLAHRAYRDPEQFWRICDANCALWPDELVAETGRKIVIPLAED